jgi:hypothetical protein
MDVLVPDRSTRAGREVAGALEDGGHRVHACVQHEGALPCAVLAGRPCPLDEAPIDVAVDVGTGRRDVGDGDADGGTFGNGALCALRRHIPLVLAGDTDEHPLAPWAAARAGRDVRATVAAVMGRPLPGQTAAARRALLHELRHQGTDSDSAAVEVFRRPGRLLVELRTDTSISRTQAERLATHIARAVRVYDHWAPKLDVTVRRTGLETMPEQIAAG